MKKSNRGFCCLLFFSHFCRVDLNEKEVVIYKDKPT